MAPLKFVAVLFLLFTASNGLATEEYYVWVDENGVVNYAEKNPPGYDARLVTDTDNLREARESLESRRPGRRRPGTESDRVESAESDNQNAQASTSAGGLPQQGSDVDPDELVSEERAKLQEEIAKVKRRNCEIGKQNLAQLQAFARIRVKDENGKERALSDEEKRQRIEQARQTIRENCSGG